MIVSIHAEADAELIAGAVHYAREANRQTAEAFLDEFDYPISLLTEFPGLLKHDVERVPKLEGIMNICDVRMSQQSKLLELCDRVVSNLLVRST